MHISTKLVFWPLLSLVRNSVALAVCLLFFVVRFFAVYEHLQKDYILLDITVTTLLYHNTSIICLFLFKGKNYLRIEVKIIHENVLDNVAKCTYNKIIGC